ncbi:hypothetical protein BBta_p0239 (plasmid) [Bradyrhizobium sp. BTAi1]|nr:hypothetical protein BBta_p0239 [Bradyrhizobium sp. BTAi1]
MIKLRGLEYIIQTLAGLHSGAQASLCLRKFQSRVSKLLRDLPANEAAYRF